MILVVEDDPQVARLISLVLQRNGHKSQVVADGQSALDRALEQRPAMIFADLTIKGMGGEALCSALKSHAETKRHPVRRRLRRPRHRRRRRRTGCPSSPHAT